MNLAESKLREWREDPRVFVREQFSVVPDAWQADVLRRFPTEPRIAMKACKGPGKTAVEAWCAWNFLATRPHPKVAATSITGDNLRDNLWAEMSLWQKRSPLLSSQFDWTSSRISYKRDPENWFMTARTWSQSADSQRLAETLAGLHADYVLFIIDESGGVPVPVLSAAEGAMTSGVETKILQGGNTTSLDGALYHACTVARALYYVVTITGDPDDPNRSPRINLENARQQIAIYGRDNPTVRINILGEWPTAGLDQLYPFELVDESMRREVPLDRYITGEPKVLGVDVARFGGDRSTLVHRQGLLVRPVRVLVQADTMQLADQVAMAINEEGYDATFIDETGLGAGVVDRLHQLGYSVVGVQFGGASSDPRRWLNKRVEMWDAGVEWLRRGGKLPNDAELRAELCAPSYWHDPKGRKCLESKEDLVKRGLVSPDKADGFVLTFAHPVAPRALTASHPAPRTTVHEWNPLGAPGNV